MKAIFPFYSLNVQYVEDMKQQYVQLYGKIKKIESQHIFIIKIIFDYETHCFMYENAKVDTLMYNLHL